MSVRGPQFPWWTDLIGWMLAGSSMILIPAVAIYKILTTKGSPKEVFSRTLLGMSSLKVSFRQRIKTLCTPWRDQQANFANGVTVDQDQIKLNTTVSDANQV